MAPQVDPDTVMRMRKMECISSINTASSTDLGPSDLGGIAAEEEMHARAVACHCSAACIDTLLAQVYHRSLLDTLLAQVYHRSLGIAACTLVRLLLMQRGAGELVSLRAGSGPAIKGTAVFGQSR